MKKARFWILIGLCMHASLAYIMKKRQYFIRLYIRDNSGPQTPYSTNPRRPWMLRKFHMWSLYQETSSCGNTFWWTSVHGPAVTILVCDWTLHNYRPCERWGLQRSQTQRTPFTLHWYTFGPQLHVKAQWAQLTCSLESAAVEPPRLFSNLTKDGHPIATKLRWYSHEDRVFIDSEIMRLLSDGIIEPSNSP